MHQQPLAEEIADCFHFYDNRGDKKISAQQIGSALRSMSLTPTEALVQKMTQQWAANPEARVSVEEFTPIYHNVKKEIGPQPSVNVYLTLLQYFDRDQNGWITIPDLRIMLQNAGEKLTPQEVDSLIFGLDDGEGKIRIEDLVKHIMSF